MTEAVKNQAIADPEPYRDSGKDVHQVKPPIVSVNPTSEKQGDQTKDNWQNNKDNFVKVSKPDLSLVQSYEGAKSKYPFADLKAGEGLFIPVEQNSTSDKLLAVVNQAIYQTRQQSAVPLLNEKGDEILEQVSVLTKKRNDDGTMQLESDGRPITGANFEQHKKVVYAQNLAAKVVTKDSDMGEGNKAPSDGVLVIRVS
jgi:hypothetical protein